MVDSTDVDENGYFTLNNLLAGDYYLGVLIKEDNILSEDVLINKSIGRIVIDADNQSYDLGDVNIKINK